MSAEKTLINQNKLFFLEMNEVQERFVRIKNRSKRTPRRRFNETGNKTGKTYIGIAEDLAHSYGCRPWLEKTDPDHKIDIRTPNKGVIGCETMQHSVMEKVWPTLKELIPESCSYTTKKNPQGQIQKIILHTNHEGKKLESEIYLRSYDQNADTFEGIDPHWYHWDEPPPKPILQAAERGKIVTNAPSWFTMTPLKEAYIYDEYSTKASNMGGDDDEISVVRGEIWENCADWCFKCNVEFPENRELDEDFEPVRPTKTCPQCGRTLGFILKAGIDEYLKTLDPEEREAREKGIWKHLSGLVYKDLDRDIHCYEDFSIPRHWMKLEGIDPHDARPSKYLFVAVAPEEIEIFKKLRTRIYVYDYLLLDKDLDAIVRSIKMKRESHGYSKPRWIVIDAKYGTRTEIEGRSWEDELRSRGLGSIRLSQSKPGDVELGHKIVREYLKSFYSTRTGTSKPGLMFAKEGCKGAGGPLNQMFNYQYKPKADKPDDSNKDFPDIVRYIAMEQPIYSAPESQTNVVQFLKERQETATKVRRLKYA